MPIDNINPLLASNPTKVLGTKKKKHRNMVKRKIENDNLLKNSIFFDSILCKKLLINQTYSLYIDNLNKPK